jgi:NAD(P)-dependent dehydrogenase (short-subunit alcohol dehydrogenase family)
MKRPISKVALVTGGARRLGRQIALALASEGFDIVISYNQSVVAAKRTVREIQGRGVKAKAIRADISRKKDIERLFKIALKSFDRIDLLVNNAATYISSPLPKTTEKIWNTTIDTNLKGTFFCAQAAAAAMVKQRTGKIINIASLGGVQAWKEHIPYSVSKAGVIMLTRILAKSLAPGIQVNAIAPGTILIDGEENPAIRHIPQKSILLQRYGQPSDITSLLVYLATTADYITGQTFIVDGGRNLNN